RARPQKQARKRLMKTGHRMTTLVMAVVCWKKRMLMMSVQEQPINRRRRRTCCRFKPVGARGAQVVAGGRELLRTRPVTALARGGAPRPQKQARKRLMKTGHRMTTLMMAVVSW
ncbi:unnamed protein product, partial [Pylaiella littoralis]